MCEDEGGGEDGAEVAREEGEGDVLGFGGGGVGVVGAEPDCLFRINQPSEGRISVWEVRGRLDGVGWDRRGRTNEKFHRCLVWRWEDLGEDLEGVVAVVTA